MPNTYKYKRFVIPVSAANGKGRCLCELLPGGCLRVTLTLRGLEKKPLNLWIFDTEKAVVYPKTLYPVNSGVLELRGSMPCCGLETVYGIALTDENMQKQAEGFTGKAIDWQTLLQTGSMADDDPADTEEFKNKVKGLVQELDTSLHDSKENADNNDKWQQITPKEIAANKKIWKYAKNPFVISEFNKYGHLLYREDAKFCFLAVPCAQNERFAGAAQGFRIFEQYDENDYAVMKCEK